ncbi:MAG: tetratricopeptide repeat protein, partial [Flammeovirgaceae bacterium]
DTSYVLTLCEYGFALDNDHDSIVYYGRKALELSTAKNYEKGLGRSFWLMGMAKYYLDQIDSADFFLQKAWPYAVSARDTREQGRISNSLANVARFKGNTAKALELYFISLRIKEQNGDRIGESITLNNIANVYSEREDFQRALLYYKKSYAIRKQLKNEVGAAMLLSTMADNYLKLHYTDSAYQVLWRALPVALKSNDPWNLTPIYNAMVTYFRDTNQPDSALYYIDLGLQAAKRAKSKHRIALMLLRWADHSNTEGKFNRALELSDTAFQMATELKRLDYQIDASGARSKALAGLGRFQEAYQWAIRHKVLSDSSQQGNFQKVLLSRELEYQLEKERVITEQARSQYESDLNRVRWLVAISIALVLLVSALAFSFYRIARVKRRSNLKLEQKQIEIESKNDEILAQNEELQQQKEEIESINDRLEEKIKQRTAELFETIKELTRQNQDLEQFSFIISHNIRAPIARMNGLLNLTKMGATPDEIKTYHQMMHDSCNHLEGVIRDLSQIINIRKSGSFQKEEVNLRELVDSIIQMFQHDLLNVKGKVKVEIDSAIAILSIKPYLHSVLLNLISNAIKYRLENEELLI